MSHLNLIAEVELSFLQSQLKSFRLMRDNHPMGSEIRFAYNSVCDRLDVLCSKMSESHRISMETKLRGNTDG